MKSFEAMFGIPAAHQLVLVRSRTPGGAPRTASFGTTRNSSRRGLLVARYESVTDHDSVTGAHSAWYRYDGHGFLTDRHDKLPVPLGELLA